MKIVVIGGSGLIGTKVIAKLTEHGHEAIAASPSSGVNTLTGEGVAEVLAGADVVIDVSNSPSFADDDVMNFFQTSTRILTEAELAAGVRHHVALSIVGNDKLSASGYMRAKTAQEKLIRDSGVPYSIVHATQFFEFVGSIADEATVGDTVRVSPSPIQPIAAEDVATEVARVAVAEPLNGVVEVAGPQRFGMDELVRIGLSFRKDPRTVVTDTSAKYFNSLPSEGELLPGDGATLFETRFEDWLPLNPAR